jgi:DNA polymerase
MTDSLEKIAQEAAACQKCSLCKTRTRTVPGTGNPRADIMFIGEGPGRNEDLQGLPFVGAAGKVLDGLLLSIGLRREDVFIANVVKCRPPMNRDPLPEEVFACADYLSRQVAIIKPKIIVLLGRHATERFLPGLKISTDHGKPKRKDGQVYFPIYHPAAAIYQRSLMETLEKDFKKIPRIIELMEKEKNQP